MKFPVERKVIGGFGFVLLLLSLTGLLAGWNAMQFVQSAQRTARAHSVLDELSAFVSELNHAETGEYGYVITANDRYLAPYYTAVGRVDAHLDTLQHLLRDDPTQLEHLAQLKPLATQKMTALRETIAVRRSQGFAVAFGLINRDEGNQLMERIQHLVETMQSDEHDRLADRTKQTIERAQFLVLIVASSSIVAIALTPFAVMFINRDITQRRRIEQTLQCSETALQLANEHLMSQVEELKQRNQAAALLNQLSDLFQACLTFEEACTVVAHVIPKFFPNLSGSILLTNASRNLVEAFVTWGDSYHSQTLFAPDECLALRRGEPYLSLRTQHSLRCNHLQPSAGESFCIPMLAQGETIGVLYLSASQPEQLTEARQSLAIAIGKQISLALANLKLRQTLQAQSIRDPLTGLYNRRYLEEFLSRELQRAQRNQQSVGIIMIDVDHFKRFNDTFGHEAGDSVLRELGLFLRTNTRSSDIACRYGGEELTLILPEASLEDTRDRAEKLREGIKHLRVQHHRQPLSAISISLGLACYPMHGLTGAAVLQAADMALYRAKAEGRDRVVTA